MSGHVHHGHAFDHRLVFGRHFVNGHDLCDLHLLNGCAVCVPCYHLNVRAVCGLHHENVCNFYVRLLVSYYKTRLQEKLGFR